MENEKKGKRKYNALLFSHIVTKYYPLFFLFFFFLNLSFMFPNLISILRVHFLMLVSGFFLEIKNDKISVF